jgi:hypothetical protein
MYRLLAVLLTGVAVATIWRRQELRNDADRASKAIVNAAATARSRLAASDGDEELETGDADTAAAGHDPNTSTNEKNGSSTASSA